MAQFYKELKELRNSRKISLEEISERTKINVLYLKAIESGNLSDIETPYLRLFLRAYAEEIGGDSQRALEQLDSFMGIKPISIISPSIIDEEVMDENEAEIKNFRFFTDLEYRKDYIIGGVFSLILIFSILIFQKIFNQESNAYIDNNGPVLKTQIVPLTNEDLLKNYILSKSSEEILPVKPPFFIKIKTLNQTALTFKTDTLSLVKTLIKPNQEINLDPFIKTSELIFTSTKDIIIFINGYQLEQVSGMNNPLQLIIKPEPPSIAIYQYKPLI
ncbi:MAG: hypothetical protein CMG60_08470 [Candidatus Marinimicrobia bacterium]|nr:hypothetical protein [Candidatus Neomarinimicrobiota bacterium]